jgi:hypothetical protein
MVLESKGNSLPALGEPNNKSQTVIVVGKNKIKLNFDPKASGTIMSDVKKMILNSLSRSPTAL